MGMKNLKKWNMEWNRMEKKKKGKETISNGKGNKNEKMEKIKWKRDGNGKMKTNVMEKVMKIEKMGKKGMEKGMKMKKRKKKCEKEWE